MDNRLGTFEIYPRDVVGDQQKSWRKFRRQKIKFDFTWLVILLQFIIIICLLIVIFTHLITKFPSSSTQKKLTTRTYEKFDLSTSSPPIQFHQRKHQKSKNEPESIEVNWSEDVSPIIESTRDLNQLIIDEHEHENSVELIDELNHHFKAAVMSENSVCSEIGRSILVRGGNAVDAAIAVSFCLMASQPFKASLGGGIMMTIQQSNGNLTIINARESAPMNIKPQKMLSSQENQKSKLFIAVPGALNGLFRAFQKFSSHRINWNHLISPTIQNCVQGFPIEKGSQKIFEHQKKFVDYFLKNNRINCTFLSQTLSEILEFDNPIEAFYNGALAQNLVDDLDGQIQISDLEDYESDISEAMCAVIDSDVKICGPPPPSMFPILVNTYLLTKNIPDLQKVNTIAVNNQHLANRISDPVFMKQTRKYAEEMLAATKKVDLIRDVVKINFTESGSTSIFIVDENNMTVSVTLSIGDLFGSEVLSKRNGFIWNNNLKFFDLQNPNSPLSIQAGKKSTSTISPFVVLRNDTLLAVSGGGDLIGHLHLLRDVTHRNYDASRSSPAFFVQNSLILTKSHSDKYSITGY